MRCFATASGRRNGAETGETFKILEDHEKNLSSSGSSEKIKDI